MMYLMISIITICVALVAIADRYFEYKENLTKEKKENNNGN